MKTTKTKKKKVQSKVALKHTQGSWDWKDHPSLEDFQDLLKPFGIVVIDHPALDGSDSYGFIFSNRKLTKKEMDEARNSM